MLIREKYSNIYIFACLVGLLSCIICHIVASSCHLNCADSSNFTDVFSDDCFVFVNQTVNITCQLNDLVAANASSLYFKKGDILIDNNNIILVDNKTAVLPYTILANDSKTEFRCYSSVNESSPVVKIVFQYIEYYPQEITNFSCSWEGLVPNKFQCFWRHPLKYIFPQCINVTFEWTRKTTTDNSKYLCPDIINFTRCDDIFNVFGSDKTTFIVNVTNTRKNVTTSTLINIEYPDTLRDLYGKPYKVEDFAVMEKNRTTIKLKWNSKEQYQTIYSIRYNTTSGDMEIQTMDKSVTVYNLTTYTIYNFDIVGKYMHLISHNAIGLPSDPVSLVVRTSQDVAKYPPRVTDGGFMISPDRINITVFWQVFEEMNDNGPVTKFKINLYNSTEFYKYYETKADNLRYPVIVNGFPARVRIQASTEVGMSAESKPIYIPKEIINSPDILLERSASDQHKFKIFVTWTAILNREVKSYTIYWCENSNWCQKQIKWKTIGSNKTMDVLQNLDSNKLYLVGISVETKNGSSGFSWKSCYYNRDATPASPAPVQILKPMENEIRVVWTRPECNELFPFIEHYIIYWCRLHLERVECLQDTRNNRSTKVKTSISDIHMNYTINHLEIGARYAVWLQAISAAGKLSPEGQKNYNASTTDSSQLENPNMTYFIVPTVIGLSFLAVIWIETRYHCGKKCIAKPRIELISIPTSRWVITNSSEDNNREDQTCHKPRLMADDNYNGSTEIDSPNSINTTKNDDKRNRNDLLRNNSDYLKIDQISSHYGEVNIENRRSDLINGIKTSQEENLSVNKMTKEERKCIYDFSSGSSTSIKLNGDNSIPIAPDITDESSDNNDDVGVVKQQSTIRLPGNVVSDNYGYVPNTIFDERCGHSIQRENGQNSESSITQQSAVELQLNLISGKDGYVSDTIFIDSSSPSPPVERKMSISGHGTLSQSSEFVLSPVCFARNNARSGINPDKKLDSYTRLQDFRQYNTCDDNESNLSLSSLSINDFQIVNTNTSYI